MVKRSNQQIADSLLRARVYSLGYSRHVADEVLKFLDDADDSIRRILLELFAVPSAHTGKRLREAESRVLRVRSRAWNALSQAAIAAIVDLADTQPKLLSKALGVKLASPPRPRIVGIVNKALAAGSRAKEWFTELKALDLKRVIAQLRIGVLSAEPIGKLVSRLTGKLSTIAAAAKNGIRTVIDSVIGSVQGAVRTVMLAEANLALSWERWVSVLDSRTTVECRALDGRRFPVKSGPAPGFHPRCRSMRVPDFDDGGSIAIGTYAAWIQTQPSKFKKYAGEVEFVADHLKPLTLAELETLSDED